MLKKFIDKLYLKWGSHNIVAMTREQMTGVNQEFKIEELGEKDQKILAVDAKVVLESPAFKIAVDNVKTRIMRHIQNEAPSADVIFYDRFSINGVNLVEEELRNYAELDFQPNEEFNPYKAI